MSEHPFVSVVLPVRNEEANLEACLDHLLSQDYPEHLYEILVVDGRSEDATRSVVERVRERVGGSRLRLLDNPGRIVPTALNIAIAASRGEVIVRMDGHTVPATDYVSSCVISLRESGAANVGGPMVPVGETAFGKAVAIAQQHPVGVGDAKFHFDGLACYVDTVYMGAFRRGIFEVAGLFDESMVRNQDYEMNIRIRKAGGKIYLDSRIRSTYTPRDSLPQLWRQYFQYGWWKIETIRRHPGSARWRQLVPPAFVLSLLVLALAAPFAAVASVGLSLLAGSYLGTLGLVALGQRNRLPNLGWMRLPTVFASMHIAWGLGFLLNAASGGRFPYRASPPRVPRFRTERLLKTVPEVHAVHD